MSFVIIYLTTSELQIYAEKKQLQIPFPPNSVSYQRVVAKEAFEKGLKESLKTAQLQTQKTIIVLSNAFIFSNEIKEQKEEKITEAIDTFIHYLPIDEHELSKIIVKGTKGAQIFAAQNSLYMYIVDVFASLGWKIEAVVPAIIFGISEQNPTLTREELTKINKGHSFLHKYNFLQQHPSLPPAKEDEDEEEKNTDLSAHKHLKNIKQAIILVISIICFGLITVYALSSAGLLFHSTQQNARKNEPTPTQKTKTPTQKISPTTPYKTKSELTIQVMNGSGISGQAGTVRDLLSSKGYSSITIATGNRQSNTVTKLTIKQSVSPETKQELTSLLQSLVGEVTVENASASGDASDIVILTGR